MNNNIFPRISFYQIEFLINLISSCIEKDEEFIKIKYKEKYANYETVIAFLLDLGLIIRRKNKINLDLNIFEISDRLIYPGKIKDILIYKLGNNDSFYSLIFWEFIENFKFENSQLFFKPNSRERLFYSDIRNFLIELHFINIEKNQNVYLVNKKYLPCLFQEFHKEQFCINFLQKLLVDEKEIGLRAELEIIEFEKERLKEKPILMSKIVHKSILDVSAGYDILSFDYDEENPVAKDRYIEVKAVSNKDFHFYWSRNEIQFSKKNPNNYFLYLLPVIDDCIFDRKNLLIINNPMEILFTNKWKHRVESFSFQKNDSNHNKND